MNEWVSEQINEPLNLEGTGQEALWSAEGVV